MVSHVTGLEISRLLARLDRTLEGRTLDDNASILVEYKGGAKGIYWASQIAVGHDNGLRLRIYGTKASLEWAQEDPNHCQVAYVGGRRAASRADGTRWHPEAQRLSRIPAGHPEGYFEALRQHLRGVRRGRAQKKNGQRLASDDLDFPGVDDGIRGVRFIERCVASSSEGRRWVGGSVELH